MTPLRRSSRLAPGSGILVLLLLLMLGLSSVLAYQAVAAARSELRLADRALRGYAGLARWELSRRADQALGDRLSAAATAGAAFAADAEDAPRALAALRSAAARELAWCACPQAVRGVFRIDAGGGARSVSTQGMQPGLRETVIGLGGTLAVGPARDTVRVWSVDAASERQLIVYH
ncbi:MAG TPA: hypothetical protein VFR37_17995, partial [Longimicrobium sp.]|nr:hypothetical protein [Longimicrobium sp.]